MPIAAHEAAKLHHRLSAIGMFAVMHHMKNMTSQKIDTLMHLKSKAHDETSLNSTILCKLDTCMQYLEKVCKFLCKNYYLSNQLPIYSSLENKLNIFIFSVRTVYAADTSQSVIRRYINLQLPFHRP